MRQLSLFGRYTWFYSPKFIVTICLTLSFYQVVNAFDQEQKRALLRFVTSCSRPPLLFVVFLFKSKSADRIVTSLLQWLQRTCSQLLHPRCRERSISSSNLQYMRQSFKSKFYHNELRMHFSPFDYFQLPVYTSDRALRVKLLQAINSGAGFDLS